MNLKLKTLSYLTKHVGKTTPTANQAATALNCTTDEYHNACTWLKRNGKIAVEGVGYGRVVTVLGVGSTLPVSNHREARDGVRKEPEPVRVGRTVCGRCGTRDHLCGHSVAYIVTRGMTAWGGMV